VIPQYQVRDIGWMTPTGGYRSYCGHYTAASAEAPGRINSRCPL